MILESQASSQERLEIKCSVICYSQRYMTTYMWRRKTSQHSVWVSKCGFVLFFFSIFLIFNNPWWLSGKKSACQFRRHGFDPWSGRSPGERQPTPVFLPKKSMDRGAWQATVHAVAKSQTWLWQLNNNNNL